MNRPIISNFYSFVSEAVKRFEFPLVDVPMACLCSILVLLGGVDSFPRDPCDRQIEQALCKD